MTTYIDKEFTYRGLRFIVTGDSDVWYTLRVVNKYGPVVEPIRTGSINRVVADIASTISDDFESEYTDSCNVDYDDSIWSAFINARRNAPSSMDDVQAWADSISRIADKL